MIAIFISAKIRNCNYMILYGFKTIQFVVYISVIGVVSEN